MTIGDLCDRNVVAIQTGPFGSQLHAHEYRPVGTPVIPTEAIGRRSIVDSDLPRVDDSVVERLARHRVRAGDILFARRGAQATGSSAIVEKNLEGALCGTGAILMRVHEPGTVDPTYLSFALASSSAMQWLRDHAVGAVMPNLNSDLIRRLEIPLPSLAEQRAIAHILGTLDDKIELNRSMNETLEAMARALFRSWFVDFDPVYAKAEGRTPAGMDAETAKLFPSEFVESELGAIPKGWRAATVGDCVTLKRGTTYKGMLVGKPGPALLGLGSIRPGGGFRGDGFKTYGGECPPDLMLRPGELYVSLKGATKDGEMIGSVARVPKTVSSGRLTQDTVKLEIRDERSRRFLYRLLLTPEYRTYCANRAMGSAVVALSREDFLSYPLTLPDAPLLARFDGLLSPIEHRGEQCDVENVELAATRDSLLPRLLSGELPVARAAREAGAVA